MILNAEGITGGYLSLVLFCLDEIRYFEATEKQSVDRSRAVQTVSNSPISRPSSSCRSVGYSSHFLP